MRKVFIIGAHRSGTSKLASYFSDILKFRGYGEGHIYRLLGHLQAGKTDIINTIPPNAYEVNRIGFPAIMQTMTQALDKLISEHHEFQDYYDKTPGHRMVSATPLIHEYIPESKFIHLHRNGIDNVNSNLRLWPDRYFDNACKMWAAPMNAYFRVKDEIGDRLIAFEMKDFITDPYDVHQKILAFLELEDPSSEQEVREYFSKGSSTSTRALDTSLKEPLLADQDWSDKDKDTFVEICGPVMDRLGMVYR